MAKVGGGYHKMSVDKRVTTKTLIYYQVHCCIRIHSVLVESRRLTHTNKTGKSRQDDSKWIIHVRISFDSLFSFQ